MTFFVIVEEDSDWEWSYHNVVAICDSEDAAVEILDSLKEEVASNSKSES